MSQLPTTTSTASSRTGETKRQTPRLVTFGAWRPGRVAAGALLFGFTLALQSRLQPFGVNFSPILVSMLPYLLTVSVLVVISIRARNQPSRAPPASGSRTAAKRDNA